MSEVNVLLTHVPKRATCAQQAQDLLAEILTVLGYRGDWTLRPKEQIRWKGQRCVGIVSNTSGRTLTIKLKPGDDSTAWSYELIPPIVMDVDEVQRGLEKFRGYDCRQGGNPASWLAAQREQQKAEPARPIETTSPRFRANGKHEDDEVPAELAIDVALTDVETGFLGKLDRIREQVKKRKEVTKDIRQLQGEIDDRYARIQQLEDEIAKLESAQAEKQYFLDHDANSKRAEQLLKSLNEMMLGIED